MQTSAAARSVGAKTVVIKAPAVPFVPATTSRPAATAAMALGQSTADEVSEPGNWESLLDSIDRWM